LQVWPDRSNSRTSIFRFGRASSTTKQLRPIFGFEGGATFGKGVILMLLCALCIDKDRDFAG
jgi:hypothetical protein